MRLRRAKQIADCKSALTAVGLAVVLSLFALLPARAQGPADPVKSPAVAAKSEGKADVESTAAESEVESPAPVELKPAVAPEASTGNFELPLFPFLPVSPFAARPFASPFLAANSPRKTGRLFGFIPNYATVEAGTGNNAVLTTGAKFRLTLQGAFDPYEFAIVGALTGVNQAEGQNPWSGHGFVGYTKSYAVAFANQAIGNVMTGAVFPSLLRQDPRYFQRSHGSFLRRFLYAGSRIFVTRGDSGKEQFNYSEFAGNAAAAAISNLYEPASSRTLANGFSTLETQIAIDAFGFEAKEFWPDIRRKLFHQH